MGSRSNTPSTQLNHSLPARPPPSQYSAAPIRNNGHQGGPGITAFAPRSVARPPPVSSASPAMMTSQAADPAGGYYANSYQQQPSFYQQPGASGYQNSAQPQIVNPFAAPGQGGRGSGSTYDPDYEAQVAQWQSAYISKDDAGKKSASSAGGANAIPLGTRQNNAAPSTDANTPGDAENGGSGIGPDGKKMTVLRKGGGKVWRDDTLVEWDPAHPRLFIGNLAGEVTDESLFKAFSKYVSVSKAHVIRDKRTTKSKGYGFVSFANTDDFFRAAKEMNGKYIGSHPVTISRATTEINVTAPPDKKKHGKHGKKGGGGGGGNGFRGAGVEKPQQPKKDKFGLKILG